MNMTRKSAAATTDPAVFHASLCFNMTVSFPGVPGVAGV
jgi:hypothetical protein